MRQITVLNKIISLRRMPQEEIVIQTIEILRSRKREAPTERMIKLTQNLVIILAPKSIKEMKEIVIIRRRVEEVGRRQGVLGETVTGEKEEGHREILVLDLNPINEDEDQEMSAPGNILEINIMIEIIDIEMTQSRVNIEGIASILARPLSTESDKRKD